MKTFGVKIYAMPTEYDIDAESKEEAEEKAGQAYNGNNFMEIYKIESRELENDE